MKNIKIYLSLLLLGVSICMQAQQQNRFWYFGNDIGLDFGPGLNNPQPIDGIGNFTDEGSGVISDANGNFLFYTDGQQAINNQEDIITTDLSGDRSSTQSSIVVPSPGNCNEVYIFSIDFNGGNDGLSYNIVNTNTWEVSTSVGLCSDCHERVTIVPHSNESDQWIVSVRPNSKRIAVYLLDASGVTLVSDASNDFIPTNSPSASYGSIKGSHDGNFLAIAYGSGTNNERVELLSFNNSTGEVDGYLNTFNVPNAYGLEFSPSSEYLLISGIGNNSGASGLLRRYRTSAPYDMANQEVILSHDSNNYTGGALQLGPDNKIYLARDESEWLDVINTPDGADWGYQEQAIVFDCTDCVDLGLPNLVGAPNECDPCNDLSASLIPNPDFETLANGTEPTGVSQLDRAATWAQATGATSDYFSLSTYPSRSDRPDMVNPPPPNESNHFVGGWRDPNNFKDDPSIPGNQQQEYIEYIGACLLEPVIANTPYTLSLDLGAPSESTGSPAVLEEELVILGIPNCNFPIAGEDCKEDNYEVIGRRAITIQGGTWQESIDIDIMSTETYPAIMFGLSCATPSTEPSIYFLADELLMVQGNLDCGNDCFSITADSPPCNSEIDTESSSTYTYDFSFTNNNDASFDKILVFETDDNFSLDAGGTLIDLGTTLAPGQSTELSWDITALNGFSGESIMYCFDIAPYNATDGVCCKESHCVELINCCPADIPPTKSAVMLDTEDCCYSFGYESCQEDYIVVADFEMLTEGLGFTASAVLDGFQVNTFSDRTFSLTMQGGGFIPDGDFDNVLQFCVDGMTSMSPEEQHFSVTWRALVGDGTQVIATDTCTISCPIPEDECAELIEPLVYCDDFGVYHYQFSVKNVNDRMLNASIAVLGPEGTTTAGDFSHQTFPDFPDHNPSAPPYLGWQQTTGVIDITLPNAVLGSSYEFILSLHDYRNLDPVTGDYWCCYTPGEFTIDVDVDCGGVGTLVSNPVDHVVFPNPATNEYTILFTEPLENDAELIMTNLNGEMVNLKHLESGTHKKTIGLQDINTGLYFISVIDEEGNKQYTRFVKK